MKITAPEGIAKLSAVFCGCGRPEDAWTVVREYLEGFGREDLPNPDLSTGEAYITAYLLNHLDLIEHGSNICGAWTTPKGAAVVDFLREYGADWMDKKGVAFVTPYGNTEMCIGGDVGAM